MICSDKCFDKLPYNWDCTSPCRYEQKEAEVVAEKLASLDSLEEKDVEKTEEKLEPKTEEVVKEEEPGTFNSFEQHCEH